RRPPDHNRRTPGDLLDRGLGDEAPLVLRLGEPLSGGAVEEDSVHAFAEVPLDQLAQRVEVERSARGEGGRACGPVAAPAHIVSVHALLLSSGSAGRSGGPRRTRAGSCPRRSPSTPQAVVPSVGSA